MSPTDTEQDKINLNANSAAKTLDGLREKILNHWLDELKVSIKSAKNQSDPILINTLPAFLTYLVQALTPNYPREYATDGNTTAHEHGGERVRIAHYEPQDILQEYKILRKIVLCELKAHEVLTVRDERIINESIDAAMAQALGAYFLVLNGIKNQFIITLTHDLRAPLTSTRIIARLIRNHPTEVEKQEVWINEILNSIDHMDRMIQDLLDVSSINAGEPLNFKFERCDIFALTKKVLQSLTVVYGSRFKLHGQAVQGYWDAEYLQRVIENLCINAVKYGDSQKPITVKINKYYERMELSVHNEGSYIPTEEQETIFNTFIRASRAKKTDQKGWGLGLSLVRGVAEGHGGSVGIDSSLERGTTFIIDIPCDPRSLKDVTITPGVSI